MNATQGLHAYGLLLGSVSGFRGPRKKDPHLVLFVQPGDPSHPQYRVAINLQPTAPAASAGLEYQIVDLARNRGAATLIKAIRDLDGAGSFQVASSDDKVPCLDYVRDEYLGLTKFTPADAALKTALTKAARDKEATVAVFGTGSPMDHRTGQHEATGYEGVDNVHMNQGAFHRTGATLHFLENGANQDGALIFLSGSSVKGFFFKFATQSLDTDASGNPIPSGIPEIDSTPQRVKKAILVPPPRPAAPSNAFVFADTKAGDEDGQFVADDDAGSYKKPFTMQLSRGKTRGPVPTPIGYPRLDLTSVVGKRFPGYSNTAAAETIAFDVIGDSGAPNEQKLPGETRVTDLLAQNAAASPPAFLFHVGDVVYYYGEGPYFFGQFFEPFRAYPAPIFAIPGNHDGVTYDPSMVSLQAFQQVFCAPAPARSAMAAGILRSTMTQPGVYFTLDAPLVSIIGLYSNCGESIGWLDEHQLLFLYNELVRLKQAREADGTAVILAIHHCPRWFPGQKPSDVTSAAIDKACEQAKFWPDAVISGHAHLYQRIVRQVSGREIPYIITGAGGYGLSALQEVAKKYVATLDQKHARLLVEYGYVRATVTKPSGRGASPTLRFEYNSTKQTSNQPDDVCTVDLSTNKLV
jgi:hypothetical protein